MWLGFALISSVLAHSPHDMASVLSRAPDGALLTNDSDLLALTTDDGQSFAYRYWFDGVAACVFAKSATSWIIGSTETGAWITNDGGMNFSSTGGPHRVTACAENSEGFVMAGPGGAWWSVDGESWDGMGLTVEWEARSLDLLENGTLLAVDENGAGWRLDPEEDLSWQPMSGMNHLVLRALDDQGQRLATGQADGEMLLSDDWGSSWVPLDNSPWNIRVLATSGQTWLAASDTEAVWVSTDEGQSWTLEDDGLDELAEGGGGPIDGVHYFHLRIEEERWLLASFEGLYSKTADADHWSQADLDIIPRVRSLQWLEGGELLVGAYGGGVYRGTPSGEDWHEISAGIGWSYPKQVVTADPAGEELWVVSGSALFHSLDGGQSWDSAPVLLTEAGDMVALHPDYPETPRVAVGGRGLSGQAAIAHSWDGGESWTVTELEGGCQAKPRALAWHEDLRVACGTDGGLYISTDDGESFEWVASVGDEVHEILSGTHMLLASDSGVYHWTDNESIVPYALLGRPITAIAEGPDGRIWVGSPGYGLGEIDGNGEAIWVGWPEGDFIEDLAISELGEIALALRVGAFWSEDNGQSFARANDYDRIDDRLQHWWLDGFGLEVLDEASTGYVQLGEPGAVALLNFSGSQIRLHGVPVAGTRISLQLDGGESEDLCWEKGQGPGLLWGKNLEPGPHELRLEVESGVLRLDGAERWQELQPELPESQSTEEQIATRCACGGRADTAWLLLPMLFFPRRRRSTGGNLS
jgi:photosystem II stability/assembly factor-like uncharacterized protein